MPIEYLDVEDVIGYHADIFNCSEQEAAAHLRNGSAGLEAALARPKQYAYYDPDADLALQAALLAHGIAEGQLFIDGNKSTAAVALFAFLKLNGHTVTVDEDQRFAWMVRMAPPKPDDPDPPPRASAEDIAAEIRACLVPLPA